jgi:hypothetical protein
MILFALATAAVLGTTSPLAHVAMVEHRGTAFRVSYEPVVQLRTRTIGLAAGTRMSTQQCRWSATVTVKRKLNQAQGDGDALATVLPGSRTLSGTRPGSCEQNRAALDAARIAARPVVKEQLAQAARGDRPTLLADIDTARALN